MITLSIPFHDLVSDNEKYIVAHSRIILSKRYRTAKNTIAMLALMVPASKRPLVGKIKLEAVLFEPDLSRTRDPSNFAKLTHDSLQGVLYENDGQIDDLHYKRGGVDADNPRLELVLTPIE